MAITAQAHAAFGGTSGLLLAEPLSVRPMGLAGAFASQADDESAIQANPAGLSQVRGFSLGGGQLIGLLGLQASQLSVVTSVAPRVSLGLMAAYLYDSDTLRDATGNESGTFSNSNLLAILALGAGLGPGWRLGGGFKLLQESYAGLNSLSVAGDLGVQGPVWRGIRFGALAQNLGVSLPLRLQGGFSLPLFVTNWRLNLEAQDLAAEGQWRSLIGSELTFDLGDGDPKAHELPLQGALRAGFAGGLGQSELGRASFGAGLTLPPSYALDYALVSVGELGATHRLSLALRFPGARQASLPGAALAAPYRLEAEEMPGGILLSWEDPNERVEGYNLYADYGVMADRVNAKPILRPRQKLNGLDKSRLYHFYVKPIGSDGKEGPSSGVLDYKAK
jgi:hypothetical protein